MKPSGVITTPEPPPRRVDAQVGDRRREQLGDVRDDPRVRVERLGVARQRTGRGRLVARVTCRMLATASGEVNGGIEGWVPVGVAGHRHPPPSTPSMPQLGTHPRRYEDPESFFIRSSQPESWSPTSETDVPAFSNAPFTRSP